MRFASIIPAGVPLAREIRAHAVNYPAYRVYRIPIFSRSCLVIKRNEEPGRKKNVSTK